MAVKERWRRLVAEIEAVVAPAGRARLGSCSVEGTRLVERALRAGAMLESAVVSRGFLEDPSERALALLARLDEGGCELVVVADELLERLTDGRSLGDIVALARLPREGTLAGALAGAARKPALLVACVGFNDPGNVGALVRTAHAHGACLVLAIGSTDAFHPRAIRTSMGSLFRVPVLALPDVGALATELRAQGVRSLGAVTSGGVALPRLAPSTIATAVVLGSEAFGLGPEEVEALDELVTIPMGAGVDSLSVNAAAATVLYELRRAEMSRG